MQDSTLRPPSPPSTPRTLCESFEIGLEDEFGKNGEEHIRALMYESKVHSQRIDEVKRSSKAELDNVNKVLNIIAKSNATLQANLLIVKNQVETLSEHYRK
ncbi:hypothetical protein HDU76_006348, partial [Blyttiomyces sp. JEL0837]